MNDRVILTDLIAGQPDLVLLWHWCLGHLSVQKLQPVIPVESSISSLDCDSWELSKIIILFFRVESIIVIVLHSRWSILMAGVLVVYPLLRILDIFCSLLISLA